MVRLLVLAVCLMLQLFVGIEEIVSIVAVAIVTMSSVCETMLVRMLRLDISPALFLAEECEHAQARHVPRGKHRNKERHPSRNHPEVNAVLHGQTIAERVPDGRFFGKESGETPNAGTGNPTKDHR